MLEKCFFLSFIHPSFFSVHLFTCLISCCEGKQLQQAGQEVHGRHVSPHAAPGGGGLRVHNYLKVLKGTIFDHF